MNNQSLLETIKKLIKQQGITQRQLSNALGCSQANLNQILLGNTRLTVEDLIKISRFLKIPVSEIFAISETAIPCSVQMSAEVTKFICHDAINFQLFNRLKTPLCKHQLLQFFDEAEHNTVRKRLNDFITKNIAIENTDGQLVLNVPEAGSTHWAVDDHYNSRIVELYQNMGPNVGKLLQGPETHRQKWRERNLDFFYLEYFSESQIVEQNRYLRHFINFIKQQMKINKLEQGRTGGQGEHFELRSIYLVSSPCPDLKGEKINDSSPELSA